MPTSRMQRERKAKTKNRRLGGGEPNKRALQSKAAAEEAAAPLPETPHPDDGAPTAVVDEVRDPDRTTAIGSSGQGTHRGRERHQVQAAASGRPDVSSAGRKRSSRPQSGPQGSGGHPG